MFDYNGQYDAVARLAVTIERLDDEGNVDGDRTEGYGIGKGIPSADGRNYEGGFTKKARAWKFFNALKSLKYTKHLGAEGIDVMLGEIFEWKHFPISGSENDFALPVAYEAAEDSEALVAHDAFIEELGLLVQEAVADGPLKKLAVQKAVSPQLNGNPNKMKALSLLVADSFYAEVDGVVLEGGEVRLAA